MNIETANRLLQYRKDAGLSQEELAEKIGVSRQAVSKWERSESSPDTDNLVALAQLYSVSLDELLGLKDNDTKPESESVENNSKEAKDEVHVSFKDGIHVNAQNGDKVDVSFKDGIHVVAKGEEKVFVRGKEGHFVDENGVSHGINTGQYAAVYGIFPIVILCLYLCWGFTDFYRGWNLNWLLFFLIPIYYSVVDSIKSKDISKFAFPVLAVGIYMAIGMIMHIWHPTWLIFITIPVFYIIAESIKKTRISVNNKDN